MGCKVEYPVLIINRQLYVSSRQLAAVAARLELVRRLRQPLQVGHHVGAAPAHRDDIIALPARTSAAGAPGRRTGMRLLELPWHVAVALVDLQREQYEPMQRRQRLCHHDTHEACQPHDTGSRNQTPVAIAAFVDLGCP